MVAHQESSGDELATVAAQGDARWPRAESSSVTASATGGSKWKYVVVRSCHYLNDIVEQDHRAIKRRCAWTTGFKSFIQDIARADEVSAAGDQPPIQLFVHQDAADWDVLL